VWGLKRPRSNSTLRAGGVNSFHRPPSVHLGSVLAGSESARRLCAAAVSNFPKQGSVSALDGATGKILWQTKSPDGGSNFGPITVTGRGDNRLVFAGSNRNFIRAFDAKDGKILWEFDTGGTLSLSVFFTGVVKGPGISVNQSPVSGSLRSRTR
jgi:outer membrane protein assembly factor BamB